MSVESRPHGYFARSRAASQLPWFSYRTKRILRRVAWVIVFIGAAYSMAVVAWIALDPRW